MQKLTLSQTKAIASEAPLTVLIAGPGSGKTRTLVERIIYLLSHNMAIPRDIVVITFTNAAAREIEKRISEEYSGETIQFYYSGTLHGFMLRLLKEHGKLIGFRGKIAMLDENQQERLLKDVIRDMKIKLPMKEIRDAIAQGPERFLAADGGKAKTDLFLQGAEKIAFEYYHRLIQSSLLDFDSLLKFGLIALKKLNETGYKFPFGYLFWDEFQDSGTDDAGIFGALDVAKKFVVGDPDQSIYGWRGGDPAYLLGLAKMPGIEPIFLRENFRCDANISRAANRLIQNNSNLHCGTESVTGGSGHVWTCRAENETQEFQYLAEDIRSQPDVNQCAILVRSNALAATFSKAMESYGIAVSKKEKVSKPTDWFVARSLINLFANPDNDLLAYWWIEQQKDTKFANKIKLESLGSFTSINRHYLKLPQDIKVAAVPAVLGQSGIGVESLDLVNKAIAQLPADATLAELSFVLGDDELHRKEVGQGLTVTTIHSAKGREWDCVYLPAFESGIIPTNSKSSSVEEERRIAFVAITRARHRLCVSFSAFRKPQFGGFKPIPATASPFMDEFRRGEQVVNNQPV